MLRGVEHMGSDRKKLASAGLTPVCEPLPVQGNGCSGIGGGAELEAVALTPARVFCRNGVLRIFVDKERGVLTSPLPLNPLFEAWVTTLKLGTGIAKQ